MGEQLPKMYRYQLFGLNILSELIFPEFTEFSEFSEIQPQNNQEMDSDLAAQWDVIIRFGKISHEGLIDCQVKSFCHQFNELSFWLNINNVGRYLIESGHSITIDPDDCADEDSIRAFILEPCIGILLTQRELFVLHGNTLKINGHHIAILGDYGCGKSSVSAAFLQKGHSISSDGLCIINNQFEVLSGYPCLNLWFDTAKYLNIDVQKYRKIRPEIDKFSIPIANNFVLKNQMIHAIFILNIYKKEDFSAQPLLGGDKIMHLQKQIYNKKYVSLLKKNGLYSGFFIQLSKKIPITLINRPMKYFQINELAEFIQKTGNLA